MACPNNRKSWLINDFRIASQVNHEGRIVDFQESPGVFDIAGNNHNGTQTSDAV